MIEPEEIEVKIPLAQDLYRYIKQTHILAKSIITVDYFKRDNYFKKDNSIWVEGNTAERNQFNLPRTKLIIHNSPLASEKWNAVLKELRKILITEYDPILKEVRIVEDETYHRMKIIGVDWHA